MEVAHFSVPPALQAVEVYTSTLRIVINRYNLPLKLAVCSFILADHS